MTTPRPARDHSLATAVATAFRRLAEGDPHDLTGLADDLVGDCTQLLEVAAAGVMLVDGDGSLKVLASSSEALHTLELFEIQAGQGPCPDALRTGRTVVVESRAELATRWPEVAGRAETLGLGAAYAVPVRLHDQVIGALNLFAPLGATLSAADLSIAESLAVALGAAVVNGRLVDAAQSLAGQLQHALNSRVRIEQAKGIVSASLGVDLQAGFDLLRGHARSLGVRLADVAEDVVTGTLPPSTLVRAGSPVTGTTDADPIRARGAGTSATT